MNGTGYLPSVGGYLIPWLATARDISKASGAISNINDTASRTATNCFMRGLSETVRISTSSNMPWEWRRICFCFRGNGMMLRNGTTAFVPFFLENSNGWTRYARTVSHNTATNDELAVSNQIINILFEGVYGTDFADLLTAKIDSTNVKVKYDRTRQIRSGNDVGVQRTYKYWLPMNANLHYDDFESGDKTVDSTVSVGTNVGMGDYYVVDFFKPHPAATVNDQIQFQPQATLYWHER